jgi:hypothetical protein
MYDTNLKNKEIGAIKEKHGKLFEPFADTLKETDPDFDIMEKLHELQGTMKQDEGYTDEMFDGKVQEYAKLVEEKINELKKEGKIPQDAVVEAKVETASPEAAPDEPGVAMAKRLRERNKNNGKESKY